MAKRQQKVKPLDLEKAINAVLSKYGDDVYMVLDAAVDEVSEEATRKLKSVVKFAPDGHPSGVYSHDWTTTDVKGKLLQKRTVVHNKAHYRLTHLLENGHVSRNGTGRTFGTVPAYPHIKPVNDWAVDELPRKVEEMLAEL